MPDTKVVWLVRHVDPDGPGLWGVYLHKGDALREAVSAIMGLVAAADAELDEDDEAGHEALAEIREAYSEGNLTEVVDAWDMFASDKEAQRWIGTVEFEQGVLHKSPKHWEPEE